MCLLCDLFSKVRDVAHGPPMFNLLNDIHIANQLAELITKAIKDMGCVVLS